MKAPTHRVPSGDRTVARLLVKTLESLGHTVTLASSLRVWDGGDSERQKLLAARGRAEAAALIDGWQAAPPDLWFTYHLYHKAPDHLGPRVAEAFGLPYVVAEPSVAPKQRHGPWAAGYAQSLACLARADALLPITGDDAAGLRAAGIPDTRIVTLAPFVDLAPYRRPRPKARETLAKTHGLAHGRLLAVAVGMMRPGDKLASYRVLAEAFRSLDRYDIDLLVVGDGPCRAEIEAMFDGRALFAGRIAPRSLPGVLAACDLFVWPAINEAYGMALLAAQAAGLPVVAGRARGVPEIVDDERTGFLTPEDDADAFAAAVARLADEPRRRAAMGVAAADNVLRRHSVEAAAATLDRAIATARAAR